MLSKERQQTATGPGRLPSPFLRELEALLSEGVLKVIVASLTLLQGLKLNAAVLLVLALYLAAAPPANIYGVVTDEGDGLTWLTWLTTPDHQRVDAFRKSAVDPQPSLFFGRSPGQTKLVQAWRVGCGKLRWPR